MRQWSRRRLGERRLGAAVAVVPALGGEVAALDREGADPAEAEVLGRPARIWALSSASSGSSPKEYVGTSRGSSSLDRQQVAGREVAGLDPLAVGHPVRGDDGLVAGDQHDLVDGDVLLPRRAGHGDRPAPADVAGAGAGEEVGDDPLALGRRRRGARRRRRRRRPRAARRGPRRPPRRGRRRAWRGRRVGRSRTAIIVTPRRSTPSGRSGSGSRPTRQDGARERPTHRDRDRAPTDPAARPAGEPGLRAAPARRARRRAVARRRPRHRPGQPLHRAARPAAPRAPRAPASPGLSRLIELHAFNAAGDAAVAISLAGTLFFQVPTGEARGQVALFLRLTMLPFAIVAPLIGPFLDRFATAGAGRSARPWRSAAFLVLGAGRRGGQRVGLAVPGRAGRAGRVQGVRRHPRRRRTPAAAARASPWSRRTAGSRWPASSAPRCRPRSPALASLVGAEWSLRYAFVLFVRRHRLGDPAAGAGRLQRGRGHLAAAPPRTPAVADGARCGSRAAVAFALRANCGPRWLSGFLTMFMAFLLRENPIDGWTPRGAARPSSSARPGWATPSASPWARAAAHQPARDRGRWPWSPTPSIALLAALFYGLFTLALLGLTAGLAQSLAKLSLDSTIQRDVPERVQTQRVRPQRHHAAAGLGDRGASSASRCR